MGCSSLDRAVRGIQAVRGRRGVEMELADPMTCRARSRCARDRRAQGSRSRGSRGRGLSSRGTTAGAASGRTRLKPGSQGSGRSCLTHDLQVRGLTSRKRRWRSRAGRSSPPARVDGRSVSGAGRSVSTSPRSSPRRRDRAAIALMMAAPFSTGSPHKTAPGPGRRATSDAVGQGAPPRRRAARRSPSRALRPWRDPAHVRRVLAVAVAPSACFG